MRINYSDRLKETLLVPGVDAKWLEGHTLEEIIEMISQTPGIGGGSGGDKIQFRQNGSVVEWRYVGNHTIGANLSKDKATFTLKEIDCIHKLVLSSIPKETKYVRLKTITLHGVDATGRGTVNSNPSYETAPDGVTFPYFGGFDPTQCIIDVDQTKEIVGDADIQEIIENELPGLQKYAPETVTIGKMTFFLHCMNKDEKDIKMVRVVITIKEKTQEDEWKILIDLSESCHKHENKIVLDELNESNGKLTYKGKEIVTGGDTESFILATQVIETLDRKFVTGQQKEALSGLTDNVQMKINQYDKNFKEAMLFKGLFNTFSEVAAIGDPKDGWTIFVKADETKKNAKTIYVYKDNKWLCVREDQSSSGWVASQAEPADKTVLWLDISNASSITLKWHNGLTWKEIAGGGGGVGLPISANDVTEEENRKFVTDNNKQILGKLAEDSVSGGLMYDGKLLSVGQSNAIDDTKPSLTTTYSSTKTEGLLATKQPKLSYSPENPANKNKSNGYVGLNNLSKIELAFLPDDALHKTHVVLNEAERDTLKNIKDGEYCYYKSDGKLFIRTEGEWNYLSDAYKTQNSAYNKLDATHNPTELDDETAGYSIGSIWINTIDKKSYICTQATKGAAQWDLMGGQINLNTTEIIPFIYDETMIDREQDQKKFQLPRHKRNECYIEISKNGKELIPEKDYVLEYDEITGVGYFVLTDPTLLTDVLHGEIYQADIDHVSEYMTKSEYDSNYDGKVDRAEIADQVRGLREWQYGTTYKTNDLILKDNVILRAVTDFRSGLNFDEANWTPVKTLPMHLDELTTADLKDTTDYRYVTDLQLEDIKKIPTIESDLDLLTRNTTNADNNLQRQINTINSYIPSGTSTGNKLVNQNELKTKIEIVKLKDLNDAPDTYVADGFVKVNKAGTAIEYIAEPRFPIKAVTDVKEQTYEDVYDLKIDKFEKASFDNGKLVLAPKLRTTDLLDMPAIEKHGAILISNQTLMQYDLIDAEELTLSQENFTKLIAETDWVLNEETQKYEYTLMHKLDSEALVISFTNKLKEKVDYVTYQIIDSSNVKLTSEFNNDIKVVINCSLGVLNGYWNHIFDISKITLIDDKSPRKDRSYSSIKLEDMFSKVALKETVYTKQEANNLFSTKTFEHSHTNLAVIEKFTQDTVGNVLYNGKKLLTDIKGRTIDISNTFNGVNQEIVNTGTIITENEISTVLGSEITIQNTGATEMTLIIMDGDITLINEKVPEKGVQKYVLGISPKMKVIISGSGKYNFYMSTI